MNRLITAVYLALMIAPFLSIAATTPYVLVNLRKTRSIHVARCAQLYLMVFFTLCAFFMTMLPFPAMKDVLAMTNSGIQLIPGYCFYDFFVNSALNVSDWTTIFPALSGSIFLGIVFNIIMLMPLGFFMRALYRLDVRRAVLIGFGVSLFFELTQLSGLFFIYPRPYRVFDVDDLIQNTLGVYLGYLIQPPFDRLIPSAKKQRVVRQGGEVSLRRRLVADLIDQTLAIWIAVALTIGLWALIPAVRRLEGLDLFPVVFLCYVPLLALLALITARSGGRTPGMRAMSLQLHAVHGGRLTFGACALRLELYGLILALPLWTAWFISISARFTGIRSAVCTFGSAVCVFANVVFLLSLFLHAVTHGEPLFYEAVSRTRLGFDPAAADSRYGERLYVGALGPTGINMGVELVYRILQSSGLDHKKSLRVRFLTEGVLLDWMEHGLDGQIFFVQMSKRFLRRTILVSVPGPEVILQGHDDTYLEVLSGTRLSFDAYYTGGMNVFAIEVP